MISIATVKPKSTALEFSAFSLTLVCVAALLAFCAPIGFSIATVFLFAGPHNWIELRYFLSRLPARFGKLKTFFAISFTGLLLLLASYGALTYLASARLVTGSVTGTLLATWDCLFIAWIISLTLVAARAQKNRDWGLAVPAGLFSMAMVWLSPACFGLCLVYLHPLVGMWILDREIERSRPEWRQSYHLCLLSIPILLIIIWCHLFNAPSLDSANGLTMQITKYAGAGILPNTSSHLLVTTHTFLEMIHYGIWLLAIPIVSSGWQGWRPRAIPLTSRSMAAKKLVPILFALSSYATVVLWISFALNYSITRDVYFTLAMAHVLAEIPFLLKTYT